MYVFAMEVLKIVASAVVTAVVMLLVLLAAFITQEGHKDSAARNAVISNLEEFVTLGKGTIEADRFDSASIISLTRISDSITVIINARSELCASSSIKEALDLASQIKGLVTFQNVSFSCSPMLDNVGLRTLIERAEECVSLLNVEKKKPKKLL